MSHKGYVQRYNDKGRTVEHGIGFYVSLVGDSLHIHFTSPKTGISKNYYICGEALDSRASRPSSRKTTK